MNGSTRRGGVVLTALRQRGTTGDAGAHAGADVVAVSGQAGSAMAVVDPGITGGRPGPTTSQCGRGLGSSVFDDTPSEASRCGTFPESPPSGAEHRPASSQSRLNSPSSASCAEECVTRSRSAGHLHRHGSGADRRIGFCHSRRDLRRDPRRRGRVGHTRQPRRRQLSLTASTCRVRWPYRRRRDRPDHAASCYCRGAFARSRRINSHRC